MGLIHVYGVSDIDFEKNGAGILSPTSASVSEEAGGAYELTLTQPIDPRGVWALLVPGNILKANVPKADIESAVVGENVDVWKVSSSSGAKVYAKPSAPQRLTYTYWDANSIVTNHDTYYPTMPYVGEGVKCTYRGNNQNYECTANIMNETAARVPPPSNAAWKEISNYTKGAAEVASLSQNTEFYLISEYSSSWLYIQTAKGVLGYIQKSQCVYVRTETVEQEDPRSISTQLFRVYDVTADGKRREVTVKARHVSYDLAGNLIKELALNGTEGAATLARIRDALLFDEECTLATNLDENDGTYTGDLSWKNPINALLDPDTGAVGVFKAKCIRDNWDIFINKNTKTDRGVRLSYGSNLLGVKWQRNTDDIINRVVPVATKANGDALMLPEYWVDSPIIDTYPVIKTQYMKFSQKVGGEDESGGTYTEASLQDYMRAKAQERFSVDDADKPRVEVTVDFVLLGTTEEYKQYKGLEKLCLYDMVTVRDPNIGLDLSLQVVAYTYDPILERFSSIKLGSAFEKRGRDVGGYNLQNGCVTYQKLSNDAITYIKGAVS